jgi:hypothetical protein
MVGEKGRRSRRPPTIILRPKHLIEREFDPTGEMERQSRENAEDAALSEEMKIKIEDYRRRNPSLRLNVSAIARYLKPDSGWSFRNLHRKISKFIKQE